MRSRTLMAPALVALAGLLGLVLAGCLAPTPGDELAGPQPLVARDRSLDGLPQSRPTELVSVADGDHVVLTASFVVHNPGPGPVRMMAYNGMVPGPTMVAPLGATITVELVNQLDQDTTLHGHGLRVPPGDDGVAHLGSPLTAPGGRDTYTWTFHDEGVFWYHPHANEAEQKELGLSGMVVVHDPSDGLVPVPVLLDDMLLENASVPHLYEGVATYAMHGRIGNVPLVNGGPSIQLDPGPQRLALAVASNARVFELDFPGLTVQLVGRDGAYLEAPAPLRHLVLAPGERAIIDVMPLLAGSVRDAALGDLIHASGLPLPLDWVAPTGPHERARAENRAGWQAEAEPVAHLNWGFQLLGANASASGPFPSSNDIVWSIVDLDSQRLGPAYDFKLGETVRLTIHAGDTNQEGEATTAMAHPIHLHGQRFLVESRDGVPETHLVWQDTVLVGGPGPQTVTLLIELDNPGAWMIHCHISEHLAAGMAALITVR